MSGSDAERARRTIERLRRHGVGSLVLTGGMAMELQMLRLGFHAGPRPLNDIDFVADSFDDIPKTLSADFLFRHVHPHDPPAKTLLQCVDPETAVRVDVFRAYGKTTERSIPIELCGEAMQVVCVEDLVARTARLCMDLSSDEPMPAKHARDFLRLLLLVNSRDPGRRDRGRSEIGPHDMESIWQEHRKPQHPQSFTVTADLLRKLIESRRDLQIVPVYNRDVDARCARCEESKAFPLADAGMILSLLGYC
ncbi:MAG: hypothetical protein ABSF53_02680 [Terracidiphilus sp.]